MRQRILHPLRPSPGERSLLIAAALLGVLGAVVAFVTVSQVDDRGALLRAWTLGDVWCVVAGATGGILGLYLGRCWLGQPGAVGTLWALGGIVWVGFLTALITGTLILPGYGTMFGPMLFGVTFMSHPLLFVGWSYGMILSHLLMREWRVERLSFAQRVANWH